MRRDDTRAGTSRMPARSFLFQTKVLRSTSKEVFPPPDYQPRLGRGWTSRPRAVALCAYTRS